MTSMLKKMLVDGWVDEGDIITFGSYAPIGGDGTKQPIEWIICNTSEYPYITLISRYALDKQPYGAPRVKWEQSSLRKWLNGTFLRTAFTKNEQNAIVQASATNQSTRSLYYDHRKNADKVEAYNESVFEKSRLKKFSFGLTVTGERVPYWRTDGSIGGGLALPDGEAYVRPTITINAKASGINWANCTYTHLDEKEYRAYRYDRGFLVSTGVSEKDYGSYYGTSIYQCLQAGDYEGALSCFSNGWYKTDKFDGLLYNKIRLHLAAEALINGDKAAAKAYLSGLYERFLYQDLKFHDFISPIVNGN
jgi:hypothetical protein